MMRFRLLRGTMLAGMVFLGAFHHSNGGLILNPRFVPLTEKEARLERAHPKSRVQFTPEVFSDRMVYWNDDGVGQFLVTFFFCDVSQPGARVEIELANASQTLDSQQIAVVQTNQAPKVGFFLDTDALKPGAYSMRAKLVAADGKEIAVATPCSFQRAKQSHPRTPIPSSGIPLEVHAQSELANTVWPIRTGVPMSFGTLTDGSNLTLLENGKPIPAQWSTRAMWTPGSRSSIKWLGLDFLARYENGKAPQYRIVSRKSRAGNGPPLTVRESDERISVHTGVMSFEVNRKRFTGIESAEMDGAKIIGATSTNTTPRGPSITDGAGVVYEAANDAMASVTIEEQGPVRVTIAARGWYVTNKAADPANKKLCQFVTRLTAYAGQSAIDVNHRTILTYDTRSNKLSNVAFTVPVIGATDWATSVDGKTIEGALPEPGKSVWLHQERADRVRLMEEEKGKHADGWLSVSGPKVAVTGMLRDIWQRFPKEFEADRNGLIFHFWPRHGRNAFTEAEELDKRNIYKAWFAHQGSFMDLQMPKAYFDQLQKWHDTDGWDPEHTRDIGYMASGEGVAIGNEFRILLQKNRPKPDGLIQHARLFQQNPHAIAAPSWNADTLAFGHLAGRDDKRWPQIEQVLNECYPHGMFNMADFLGDYGMWIYGNTHNPWDNTQPRLHRAWQNSHYQHVGGTWLLYARSASPELLRWARANTDEFMDVGTCNYHNPERPLKGHITGAMYHAKGFVPWGSRQYGMFQFDTDIGVWGHWVDPDAFLMRYYIEGNPRALDLYKAWSAAIFGGSLPYSAGRELSNTFGMLLNYYEATWDPTAIPYLKYMADGMLEVPFEQFPHPPSFPMWHKTWLDRYYDLTRDERVVPAVKNYIAAGFEHIAPNAFAYRATGEKKYLTSLLPGVDGSARMVYHNPDDPLDCFGSYHCAVNTTWLPQVPYFLRSVQEAKLSFPNPPTEGEPFYLVGSSHLYSQTRRAEIALTVLALDADDREFKITIEPLERGIHPAELIVVSPSGKVVHESGALRPTDDTTTQRLITIPKDGERGVYAIEIFGHLPRFHAPLTGLPHEIARLTKDNMARGYHSQSGFFCLPPNSTAKLTFTGLGYGATPGGNYIYVEDSAKKPVLEASLLVIGQRKEASLELTAGPSLQTWRFYAASESGPGVTWTGSSEAFYVGRRVEDFEPILKALPQPAIK